MKITIESVVKKSGTSKIYIPHFSEWLRAPRLGLSKEAHFISKVRKEYNTDKKYKKKIDNLDLGSAYHLSLNTWLKELAKDLYKEKSWEVTTELSQLFFGETKLVADHFIIGTIDISVANFEYIKISKKLKWHKEQVLIGGKYRKRNGQYLLRNINAKPYLDIVFMDTQREKLHKCDLRYLQKELPDKLKKLVK